MNRIIKSIPPEFKTYAPRTRQRVLASRPPPVLSELDCTPSLIHEAIRAFKPPLAWLRYKGALYFRTIHTLLPMHHAAILNFMTTHPIPYVASSSMAIIADTMIKLDFELSFIDLQNLIFCKIPKVNWFSKRKE
jgi:hypothetical protein